MAEIIWDSELGPEWPDDWPHTTVHAQFVAVTGDGADTDRLPDIAPSGNGEVLFTPSLRTVRYVGADGPYVVSLKQYRAVVDSEGYLCTPDTFGQPGERGIVLPSTDAEVLEPRGEDDNAFTWRVDFDIPAVNIRSDHIAVPVGGPYNLVDLLSPERAAGVVHVIDRVSARDAIEAASDAEAARDQTLAARDETLQHGITVDTSVGTRVYVGNTMIYGDTGPRDVTDSIDLGAGWFGDTMNATVQRTNNTVTVIVNNIRYEGDETGHITVFTLPTGFRPNASVYGNLTLRGQAAQVRGARNVAIQDPSPLLDYFYLTFLTNDPWPTSLPGTPA